MRNLPTLQELRSAKALPIEALNGPSMPADPTFLDKPLRGYMLRFLVVMPCFSVFSLIISFAFSSETLTASDIVDIFDTCLQLLFSCLGYYALKRMIPEWILLFACCDAFRCLASILASIIATVTFRSAQSQDVSLGITFAFLIVGYLFSLAITFTIIRKIVLPLFDYALECRKRLYLVPGSFRVTNINEEL
ncbi:hypothetical protein BC830DRAFT_1099910, partial [Chytriomyces sp. MP71]